MLSLFIINSNRPIKTQIPDKISKTEGEERRRGWIYSLFLPSLCLSLTSLVLISFAFSVSVEKLRSLRLRTNYVIRVMRIKDKVDR